MSTESTKSGPETAAANDDVRGSTGTSWLQALRARLGMSGQQTLRDTIEYALRDEDRTAQAFSVEERVMLLRLLRFGASRVEDIMVPRADIIAVEESEPIHELLRTFEEAGVSRIPLYHDTLDDPRGMVHVKDLFRWLMAETQGRGPFVPRSSAQKPTAAATKPAPDKAELPAIGDLDLGRCDLGRPVTATKLRRQVLYVPPSMPAMNLLIRMQATRIHMALVVDEYGGTDGLVTIEDLVEQIVGDIEDEHDEAEAAHISRDPKLGLVASARTPVKELEEHLGTKLLTPEEVEEIDTLGGLIFTIVGRVPTRGEIVRHASGVEFEVLDADPRRVKKIRIHLANTRKSAGPPASPTAER